MVQANRVLIVDDDASLCNTVSRAIRQMGYVCDMAGDGLEGLERLAATPFDVAVVDLEMPRLDGVSLIRAMREREIDTVPIIMSGHGEIRSVVEAMQHGAFDFIEKPARHATLKNALDRAVRHHEAIQRSRQMTAMAEGWQSVFNASPDIIFVLDPDFRLVLCNKAAADRMGKAPEDLLGLHAREALCELDSDLAPLQRDPGDGVNQVRSFFHRAWNGLFDITSIRLKDGEGCVFGTLHTARDVTAQERAQEALRRSEEEMRTLIENLNVGVYRNTTDAAGRFLKANTTLARMFGYDTVEEFMRVRVIDLYDDPEDRHAFLRDLQQHGSIRNREIRVRRRDGSVFWIACTGQIQGVPGVWTKWVDGVIEDITERRMAEEALRESEEKYRRLVDNLNVGVYRNTGGSEGRFLQANPLMARLFGYDTVEEFLRTKVCDLYMDPSARARFAEAVLHHGRVRDYELHLRRKDGTPFWAHCTAQARYDETGAVAWIDGLIEDVTERKQYRDDLAFHTALLKAQCEATVDGILVLDESQRILLANQRFTEMWKIPGDIQPGDSSELLLQYALDVVVDPETFRKRIHYLYAHRDEVSEDEIHLKDGNVFERYSSPLLDTEGNYLGRVWYFRDITQRRRAEEERIRLITAIEHIAESIVITEVDGSIVYVNPAFERINGYTREEALGQTPRLLKSGKQPQEYFRTFWETILSGRTWTGNFVNKRKDGTLYEAETTVSPVLNDSGAVRYFVAVTRDVTHLVALESQLRQAQKLESIGQLAAGIAHEINTPIQYVGDNTRFLSDAFKDLNELQRIHDRILAAARAGQVADDLVVEAEQTAERIDLDYLKAEIPGAIEQSLDGVERVARIVRAMKEFSHPGVDEKTLTDINKSITSTVTVARNEWKYVADLETDLEPDLPLVPCYPGEFNQAILNLIINSAHAIAEVVGRDSGEKGRIDISTRLLDSLVEIRVADSGGGIPPAIQDRIFDPFFTTKEVGRGTGQGLSIARSCIVNKLGGSIDFETEIGKGTTFIIRLPLAADDEAGDV